MKKPDVFNREWSSEETLDKTRFTGHRNPQQLLNAEMDLENATAIDNMALSDDLSVVDIVVIVVDVILIVIICGGNVLTLLAVWLTPALRTVPNMYVVSLAVADLLAGLVIPYTMLVFIPGMQEVLDGSFYACIFRYSLFFISGSESIMCLMAISLDRWLYISKPLRYISIVTPLRAGLFIALTWCLAIVYGTAPLFDNNWTPTTKCKLFNVLTMRYQVYGQCTSYIIGVTVCIIAYINIFKTAYIQRRRIEDVSSQGTYRDRLKKAKTDWHLIKLFVIVFGIFFICWTPTFVCVALGYTVGIPYVAMDIVGPLSVLNSGMNFFIYAYKNKDFRQAFARILCIRHRSARSGMNTHTAYTNTDVTVVPHSRHLDMPVVMTDSVRDNCLSKVYPNSSSNRDIRLTPLNTNSNNDRMMVQSIY